MIYTAYSEEEYKNLPQKYKKRVLGVSYEGNILQVPLCPECGSNMMEVDGFLSCVVCGRVSGKRIIRDETSGHE